MDEKEILISAACLKEEEFLFPTEFRKNDSEREKNGEHFEKHKPHAGGVYMQASRVTETEICIHSLKINEKEKGSLPGVKKSLGKYGPSNVEDTSGSRAMQSKDHDDIDLFGSEKNEEEKKLQEEHLTLYESKKAKNPALVAKSSILLDVKSCDDETDMAKLECIQSIQADGLGWRSSKLVPVGYGIEKLPIQCVVEDDKIATDMLEEQMMAFEDYVQSMDMAALTKSNISPR
ncbi:elongation factor 1-beta-like [Thomomys bottae]